MVNSSSSDRYSRRCSFISHLIDKLYQVLGPFGSQLQNMLVSSRRKSDKSAYKYSCSSDSHLTPAEPLLYAFLHLGDTVDSADHHSRAVRIAGPVALPPCLLILPARLRSHFRSLTQLV